MSSLGLDTPRKGVIEKKCQWQSPSDEGDGLRDSKIMGLFSSRDKQATLVSTGVGIPSASFNVDDDAPLVRRCRLGDTDAYGLLVARHERRVYAILCRILSTNPDGRRDLGETVDLEDLAQEIFVQAWRAMPRFRGDAKFSTWLYRIATNRALKEWKRLRQSYGRFADPLVEHDGGTQERLLLVPDTAATPEQCIDQEARDAEMRRAVDELPEKQRTVILLHYFEEQSCEQIAEITGCSVGTVWSRLHYAIRRLRCNLKWLETSEV